MKKRGKGVALIYYPIGLAGGGETSQAFVKIKPDGGADLFIGSSELGQGCKTVAVQILSDELGIPAEKIVIHNKSTDDCGICTGSFSSRVTYFMGNAVLRAAKEARDQLFEYAVAELGVSADELSVGDGKIFVTNDPQKSVNIGDIASKANFGEGKMIMGKGHFFKEPFGAIDENGQFGVDFTIAYGASVAEVEVDTTTGEVDVLKMYNVFDTGKTINPMLALGQVNGGVMMGIGSTLMEDISPYYPSTDFAPKTFSEYMIPTASDMPELISDLIEIPVPNGPYGAKGIGEMTANTASPAIVNAIYDAVNVWVTDMPVTPEKVLAALRAKNN